MLKHRDYLTHIIDDSSFYFSNFHSPLATSRSLGDVISGISASRTKSLTVEIQGSTARNYTAIANMLHVAASLKMLKIDNDSSSSSNGEDDDNGGRYLNDIFCALGHPGCGVERLELWCVTIRKDIGTTLVNRQLQVLVHT
jgi:hypothetical protein